MLRSIKRIWVKALKSGEFEQGRGKLAGHGRYCCLGVLRKVCPQLGTHTSDGGGGQLTGLQCRIVGLPVADQIHLIRLNDGHEQTGIRKHSFREIAAWINKNL